MSFEKIHLLEWHPTHSSPFCVSFFWIEMYFSFELKIQFIAELMNKKTNQIINKIKSIYQSMTGIGDKFWFSSLKPKIRTKCKIFAMNWVGVRLFLVIHLIIAVLLGLQLMAKKKNLIHLKYLSVLPIGMTLIKVNVESY